MQKALIFFLKLVNIQNYITQSNKEKLKKEKGVEIEKKTKRQTKNARSSN